MKSTRRAAFAWTAAALVTSVAITRAQSTLRAPADAERAAPGTRVHDDDATATANGVFEYATTAEPLALSPALGLLDPSANDFVLDHRDLVIEDSHGHVRVRIDATTGDTRVFNEAGDNVLRLESGGANIFAGGGGSSNGDGDLVLTPAGVSANSAHDASVRLDAAIGAAILGGNGTNGMVVLRDAADQQTIALRGADADLVLGQHGQDGDLFVRDEDGVSTAHVNGATGTFALGGNDWGGTLLVRDDSGEVSFHVQGNSAELSLGSASAPGFMSISNEITLDGSIADITVGGRQAGSLALLDDGAAVVSLDAASAEMSLGGQGKDGLITAYDAGNHERIVIDAEQGRVQAGADLDTHTQLVSHGIVFPDGSLQETAQLQGPAGPAGPAGPPGPPVTQTALCGDGTSEGAAAGCGFVCAGQVIAQLAAPCDAVADNGSCSAGSYHNLQTGVYNAGRCCVCAP
jgi:hypothetical protein